MANQTGFKLAKVAQLRGHRDSVYDLAINQDGSRIYSAGADGYLVSWDWRNSSDGELVLQTDTPLYAVHYSSSEHQLWAGDQKGKVYQLDLDENRLLSNKHVHRGGVFGFIESEKIWSHGEDGKLISNEQQLKIAEHSLRSSLLLDDQILVGSSDHHIYQLNLDLSVNRSWKAHENSVFGLAYLGGDVIASGGRDAQIRLWDLKTYRQIHAVDAHLYQVTSLDFDHGLLLSSSMDKSIRIWSDELQLLKVADPQRDQGHSNCVNRVCWLNESMFVSSSDDRSLIIWEIQKIV